MTYRVSVDFINALKASDREIDIRCKILNRDGTVRYGPAGLHVIDGTFTMDWRRYEDSPVRQVEVTFADPDGVLNPTLANGDQNPLWFSRKLRVDYGVRLPNATWEYCPLIHGFIPGIRPGGDGTVTVYACGKEIHHQPPSALRKTWWVLRGTKWSQALRDLLDHRGIDDEILDIPVLADDETIKSTKHYGRGMSPWKIFQHFARQLDEQFFFRGDGHPTLRPWPDGSAPVWEFTAGEDSVVLDFPDLNFDLNDFFNQAYVLTENFVDDGPQNATRPEPVMGFAELPDADPLSAKTLSNSNKPVIREFYRPDVKSIARANQIAQQYIDGMKTGIEVEMSIETHVLPHLEEMDPVRVNIGATGLSQHKFRIKNLSFGLKPDSRMIINNHRHVRDWLREGLPNAA